MSSSEYWAKREAEALKHRITDEKEYDRQLQRIYSDMLDACQREINAFYGKYAAKEGITLAEAKKAVSKLDIAAYERKAKRYVRDKDFSAKANEEMRLYNATMKINRLEMLKANIGLELITGHDELEKFMDGILQGRTEDELKRQAGILGKTVKNNAQKANAIVNASFHNAKFSDRIWMYQDLMKADLSKLLQSGLIQGKNPRTLARELKKTFNTSTFNAERLMRTELARVQTEAQKQSFERNGFDEYEFIVNAGCCDICQGLNGKHFPVSKMMPGENAPPIHPHCRCSTAAYSDRKEYDEWLDFLEKGGTTEEYNRLKEQKVNTLLTSKAAGSDIIGTEKGISKETTGLVKIGTQFFASKEKQFGKKVGKHAKDYGLNPSKAEDREKFRGIIDDIMATAEKTKIGFWRGQKEDVLFYIKGEDVVITDQNNEFITLMKGGAKNERVKNARNK
ncbi:MAG: minor capsid protein [Clostridia bacterium]|nr:minor capsid protein [Clostridia bacterium]MBO7150992.1 minor capsid protein [Clostridia bacterium]